MAQYTVQPHDTAANRHTFTQPEGAPTRHAFTWAPDRVSFRSATVAGRTIADWCYSGPDVPCAGEERTRINLWLHGGKPPTDGAEVEIVLSEFTFTGL